MDYEDSRHRRRPATDSGGVQKEAGCHPHVRYYRKSDMNALSELYNTDFHAWALETAALIRQHKFEELNIEDLAEELVSMGKKERAEVANRLVILLAHLLKWQYQPAYRSASWRGSLIEQRKQLWRQLQQNPSVKPYFPEAMAEAYPDAVDLASRETLLSSDTFPPDCPYSEDQVLDYDFYPERPGDAHK